MNPFFRLLQFARPHRGRLVAALAAMLLYAAATAGVAALIQPIFDQVLPSRENLVPVSVALLSIYFIKGIAAYLSGYLMTDVGQRVVRDLRNVLDDALFFDQEGRREDGQRGVLGAGDLDRPFQALAAFDDRPQVFDPE